MGGQRGGSCVCYGVGLLWYAFCVSFYWFWFAFERIVGLSGLLGLVEWFDGFERCREYVSML